MIAPRRPTNERERLAALAQYDILDTPEESVYDAFTELAREITGTKIALVSLIDENRQWFKAHAGLATRETPREQAFCDHVVASGASMVVEDARADVRFKDNPLVTGDPNIVFYAGVPLTTSEGHTLGTLCVIDPEKKHLSAQQERALVQLANALMLVLDGRRRFLSLFDAAHIDVFTVDPVDGSILFASRGACMRLGYDRRELIGMPIYDVATEVDSRDVREIALQASRGDQVVRDTFLVRKDGTHYPVEFRVDITHERGEERILAIATDLTQRKLQESEIELLLGAINAAGDVILVYEVGEHGELCVSYVNDAYAAQSGYTREEVIGRSLDFFRHSMPDDEGMRIIRAAVASGTATQAEVVSYRKDGTTYWNQVTMHPIQAAGNVVTHWISIERDISEEVERTSALAEEHDRLLALTRAARRLFTALDARALVATVIDVLHQLLAASVHVLAVREDGSAVNIEELGVIDWTAARHDALAAESLTTRSRVVDAEQERCVAYGGQFGDATYALEVQVHPAHVLRNTDLFVLDLVSEYFAVAARNVALYQELDERRSAVLELNQTKSDLIAMLAHDFRGPLTSIVGFSDLTAEVGDVNEEQQEFLETIKRSALQLSELATDTLTLSRLERNEVTLQLAPVDLEALLRSIIAQYADRRHISIATDGNAQITGDEDRLRQVFANLIDNAIKYSPDGGEPSVEVHANVDGVTVRVSDRGIGIPAGEVSRIFDRFSRASNARKMRISGTGFGLFLTKQLVRLHGGTIAVESEEGRGSTFIVTLPRHVDRRAAPRTIVVLDPERERSFLAYGLQEAGYRIIAATTLEDVLAIADGQSVDVLLLNVLDGMSNADAVKFRAFSREHSIPVIAMSNEAVPRLAAAAMLPHPVLVSDVVSAIERVTAEPLL